MTDPKTRLIVALDVPGREAALEMVRRLHGRVGCFKVGLELFVRGGPRLVEDIRGMGEEVFLDLKFHDIPNTVAGAVRSACTLGVRMLTVHAAGGRKMMAAAKEAAAQSAAPPLLLAVSALTSLGDDECLEIGVQVPVAAWVDRLAQIACDAAIPGLVASPLELPSLRRRFAGRFQLITPGIRPSLMAAHDQARSATPRDAIEAGADYIVVGRPILQAEDPAAAADAIVAEVAGSSFPQQETADNQNQ
jgi:orotidine-5'-phosphate decarboxylase